MIKHFNALVLHALRFTLARSNKTAVVLASSILMTLPVYHTVLLVSAVSLVSLLAVPPSRIQFSNRLVLENNSLCIRNATNTFF